jgi:hypothetical protein
MGKLKFSAFMASRVLTMGGRGAQSVALARIEPADHLFNIRQQLLLLRGKTAVILLQRPPVRDKGRD